ncbi:hypothetical protein DPQ33_11945 [Oceanidesulfovibrio indonesiensis]|uniref:HTH luxR-type domain-containing protein n=1 Tax=Oceanidesulfovibrio indonesiensis TaxID=54767 RepID=A0A7M3MDK6_9BACT|nr:hypothetical protein [Oceanidesulfovibrio indonesiensis]TVM16333.1 hypothetical protein DPQ33_11945 [Oceanidesulfovibrio indonesiensis]
MALKNKYVGRAKLSQRDFIRLVGLFAMDMEAARIARELGFSRNTVNAYMRRIRERIAEESCIIAASRAGNEPATSGAFFVIRSAGNRGRSRKAGRMFLHGRVHEDKRLSIDVQKGHEAEVLHSLLGGRLQIDGQVFAEGWSLFSRGMEDGMSRDRSGCTVPGVTAMFDLLEDFLVSTRIRLEKFRGIKRTLVRLHIKESEFRFNNGENVERVLLEMLRKNPL